MTDDARRRGADGQQDEALDAFLNARARGNPSPRSDLDGSLVATVHRLQDLADATLRSNVSGADEARMWEALMHPTPRPRLLALSSTHDGLSSGAAARMSVGLANRSIPGGVETAVTRIVPTRRAAPPSRLRRLGSRSLGLVATLTLVALIGLSGLAVYLSAPRDPEGNFTQIGGAVSSTPAVDSVLQQPGDLVSVTATSCSVARADFDETMRVLAAPATDRSLLPASLASAIPPVDMWSATTYVLPQGDNATNEQITAVEQILGRVVVCSSLQEASLYTSDGLVRLVYGSNYGYSIVIGLWQDDQAGAPRAMPSGLDVHPRFELYGFRVLDDQHVAAYIELPGGTVFSDPSTGLGREYYPKFDQRGYIVIEQQPDGQWLIDDFVYPALVP